MALPRAAEHRTTQAPWLAARLASCCLLLGLPLAARLASCLLLLGLPLAACCLACLLLLGLPLAAWLASCCSACPLACPLACCLACLLLLGLLLALGLALKLCFSSLVMCGAVLGTGKVIPYEQRNPSATPPYPAQHETAMRQPRLPLALHVYGDTCHRGAEAVARYPNR